MSVPPPPTPRHRAGKVSLLFGLSYTMESALCLWDSVCWSITTMSPSGDILCMLIWRLSEGFSSGDYYLASFLENFLTIILLKIVSLYFLFLRLLLDVNVVAFNLLIFLTFFFFFLVFFISLCLCFILGAFLRKSSNSLILLSAVSGLLFNSSISRMFTWFTFSFNPHLQGPLLFLIWTF